MHFIHSEPGTKSIVFVIGQKVLIKSQKLNLLYMVRIVSICSKVWQQPKTITVCGVKYSRMQ